jgi:hypothetical protein
MAAKAMMAVSILAGRAANCARTASGDWTSQRGV